MAEGGGAGFVMKNEYFLDTMSPLWKISRQGKNNIKKLRVN